MHVLNAYIVNEVREALHDVSIIVLVSPSADKFGGEDLLNERLCKWTKDISAVITELYEALSGFA